MDEAEVSAHVVAQAASSRPRSGTSAVASRVVANNQKKKKEIFLFLKEGNKRNIDMPSHECTRDNNLLPLSLISSILTDIRTTSTAGDAHRLKCIYMIIANALFIISCINNLISIQTLFRHRIRITPLGVYLIRFTIFSTVEMFALEVSIVLRYTRELSVSKSYRYFYCNILNIFSVTPSFLALWLSAFVAIERVLIQCFKLTREGPKVMTRVNGSYCVGLLH